MINWRDLDIRKTYESSSYIKFGGNSTVRKLTIDGKQFAFKDYSGRHDGAQRLVRDFSATKFLNASGYNFAAKAEYIDEKSLIGVYGWLDGKKPELTAQNIDNIANIIEKLFELSTKNTNLWKSDAVDGIRSNSGFSIQIINKISVLKASKSAEINKFFEKNRNYILEIVRGDYSRQGHDLDLVLLSPSDFGPHNMLCNKNILNIFDLEFFGWDSYYKLVADTILHPRLLVADNEMKNLLSMFINLRKSIDTNILNQVLILASIKWSLIILDRLSREAGTGEDRKDINIKAALSNNAQIYINIARLLSNNNNKSSPTVDIFEDLLEGILEMNNLRKNLEN